MEKKKKSDSMKEKRSNTYNSTKEEAFHEFSEELADGGERNEIIAKQKED